MQKDAFTFYMKWFSADITYQLEHFLSIAIKNPNELNMKSCKTTHYHSPYRYQSTAATKTAFLKKKMNPPSFYSN